MLKKMLSHDLFAIANLFIDLSFLSVRLSVPLSVSPSVTLWIVCRRPFVCLLRVIKVTVT